MFHGGKSSPGDDPASWDEVYHAPQAGTTWANTHPDYKKHAWKSLENIESSYLRMNQAQRLVSKRLDQVRKKLKIKSCNKKLNRSARQKKNEKSLNH